MSVQSEQALQALQLANVARLARAQVRQGVAAGRMTVTAALADPACAAVRAAEVLAWQRRWSECRAERFLLNHDICSPFAEARSLTDRQRALVARALRTGEELAA